MALPQEAIAIQQERDAILAEVNVLRAKSKELKKRFDSIVERANLTHKLGALSESEKAALRDLL